MNERQDNPTGLRCYRCGFSLQALSLPLSRRDQCPDCGVDLHVCRLCRQFAPGLPDDCREEDAVQVRDKAAANFCDFFAPDPNAFDGAELSAEAGAKQQLAALFGESGDDSAADTPASTADSLQREADRLFGK